LAGVLTQTAGTERSVEQNGASSSTLEVSVVMPCLNEADTLAICIEKAQRALHDVDAEIIVADNGSTDGSQEIAESMGARVVPVEEKGYGSALMGGIAAAQGRYVIMGDADDSYDFLEIPKLLGKLREGNDLVQGCRLDAGGGTVMPDAMPWLHQHWGNPMLSSIARRWFKVPVTDIYCGFRGFRRDWHHTLDQRCTGMEFATEMIIRAAIVQADIAETPITLHPDGRKSHPPHLRTFRDGWRTLRFFLLYTRRRVFLIPGLMLILAGIIGYALALPAVTISGVTFDAHTLVFASLALMCGYQAILFGIFSKTFAMTEGLIPPDPRLDQLYSVVNLERGLLVSFAAMLIGLGLLTAAVLQWQARDFGGLDYAYTMRWVLPGSTLTALGFQTALASFFVSILGLRRR
jgi:glycosyltransferase involved in cell wall biosynthesis